MPGILVLWYPGMEGGHALADIVLGLEAPAVACRSPSRPSEDHLPLVRRRGDVDHYGPLHGQRLLDHLGVEAAFPFGFGLTYPEGLVAPLP